MRAFSLLCNSQLCRCHHATRTIEKPQTTCFGSSFELAKWVTSVRLLTAADNASLRKPASLLHILVCLSAGAEDAIASLVLQLPASTAGRLLPVGPFVLRFVQMQKLAGTSGAIRCLWAQVVARRRSLGTQACCVGEDRCRDETPSEKARDSKNACWS